MRKSFKNLKGRRFGRLDVLRDSGRRISGGRIVWLCFCLCGNFTEVAGSHLLSGHTRSCGCLYREHMGQMGRKNKIHGDGYPMTRLYRIWAGMKYRCLTPGSKLYKYYGGRGIKICEEWKNNYLTFKKWALANGYKDNLTIDKINNNGNYEPKNCQWITAAENTKKGSK